jgi:pilus assembly protein Flp/PilA
VRKSNIHRDENGQDLVEYGLLAGLIAVATIAALQLLSGTLSSVWAAITSRLSN